VTEVAKVALKAHIDFPVVRSLEKYKRQDKSCFYSKWDQDKSGFLYTAKAD